MKEKLPKSYSSCNFKYTEYSSTHVFLLYMLEFYKMIQEFSVVLPGNKRELNSGYFNLPL